jgi:hypothetical protein
MKNSIKITSIKILNRIKTLRKDVLFFGTISIISILLTELLLKYIPSFSRLHYDIGQVYIKFCYSFTSALLFYFIVVHLPREKRKLKSYRYINNKIARIDHELRILISLISSASDFKIEPKSLTIQELENACKKINPQNKVYSPIESNESFATWFDYLNFKGKRIKKEIQELFVLNETLDTELFEYLTFLDDEISNTMNFERQRFGNTDLSTWSKTIFELLKNCEDALESMRKRYYRYAKEYHYSARIRNQKRNESNAKETI